MNASLDEYMKCRVGDNHFNAGRYPEAKKAYWRAAKEAVGASFRIPGVSGANGGARNDKYIGLNPYERANLQGCCVGLARCFIKEGDLESASAWLEESNILHQTAYYNNPKKLYDWRRDAIDLPELSYRRAMGLNTSCELFMLLDNTAIFTHRRYIAYESTKNLPNAHKTPRLEGEVKKDTMRAAICLRHPDPVRSARYEVKDPNLQILGSWQKLPVRSSTTVKPRYNCQSFIWKGHFYVGGGQGDGFGPFHRDLWCLNLEKVDGWKQLPSYPRMEGVQSRLTSGWQFRIHETATSARAYLFNGDPILDYFNLKTRKWGSVETTYDPTREDERAGVKDDWPWRNEQWYDGACWITQDRMFIFGGTHNDTMIGCNLFMELDLKTFKWRRLTGYVMPPKDADYDIPGPRKSAAHWVSKDTDRIYLLFGVCDRIAAPMKGEMHGGNENYAYGDFWSWSIKEEKWRLERLAGNPPCPRMEMGYAYNPKLDKVVIFGGYSPCQPTRVEAVGQEFEFSYFSDTFIYQPPDPENPPSTAPLSEPALASRDDPKFKQVLTRGFPTYRCQMTMACDSETGKTYLFGGFTNSDYIPGKANFNVTRSFGDVWQLRLDMPGGFFDKVDLEEEARTSKAGPWQRCFACGDAGRWKRCGGSCKGKAYFCNSDCLKEGWKEHKKMHQCQKL